jgi:trehalose 6-phosphate synthase
MPCRGLISSPEAVVFFHDYHLYLAPQLVRERAPETILAHFVHIPWVEAGGWSVLPAPIRAAIHEGLLANDLVGFHSERWRRVFVDACASLLDVSVSGDVLRHAGGSTTTVARPISVDPQEFEALATSEGVAARLPEIRADQHEQLIVRVDRTDPKSPARLCGGLARGGTGIGRSVRAARPVAPGHPGVRDVHG